MSAAARESAAAKESAADGPAVRVRDLRFSRGSKVIFQDLNLDIPRGKVTAVLGPSGCGKTTLLRAIGRQIQPAGGTVSVLGADVNTLKAAELRRLRQRIGMLFQNGALFTDLTAFDNVAFALREQTDHSEAEIAETVLAKLDAVGLKDAAALYPRELSGGMMHRVALARAIAMDPELVMYDEPFAGQDPITIAVLIKLIRRLNDTLGLTSIVVTHDIDEALGMADQLFVLHAGTVLAQGTPDELREGKRENAALRQFLDGLADGPLSLHADSAEPAPAAASARAR